MGECTSRPIQDEITKHILVNNKKNDECFTYELLNTLTNESLLSHTRSSVLQQHLKYLEEKTQNLHKKLEICSSSIPELKIEVQKAVNLFPQPYCLNKGKPFVQVSLEPDGPQLRTFESTMFTPSWFKLFCFREQFAFSFVLVKVLTQQRFGEKTVGTFKVSLAELRSQTVRENWFELENCQCKGMIRLRMQFVHDEKELIKYLICDAEEKIRSLRIMIKVLGEV